METGEDLVFVSGGGVPTVIILFRSQEYDHIVKESQDLQFRSIYIANIYFTGEIKI